MVATPEGLVENYLQRVAEIRATGGAASGTSLFATPSRHCSTRSMLARAESRRERQAALNGGPIFHAAI